MSHPHSKAKQDRPTNFVPAFMPFYNEQARYKIAWGGRGGAKSVTFAKIFLTKGSYGYCKVLCVREVQGSIKNSVWALLKTLIEAHDMPNWEITHDEIRNLRTGSLFHFKGLSDQTKDSLKSFVGYTHAWVEEGQSISKVSRDVFIPSIRSFEGCDVQPEIWVSMNRESTDDPMYQIVEDKADTQRRMTYTEGGEEYKWTEYRGQNIIAVYINFDGNPFFPSELEEDRLDCLDHDSDAYAHIWLGHPRTISEAQVFYKRWRSAVVPVPPRGAEFHFGADWGFANDPTTLIRCWIDGMTLYVDRAVGGVRVDIVDTPALFDKLEGAKPWPIIGDCARPETISHMCNKGYRVRPSMKGKGSIEDGIKFLRSYDIVIDESLTDVIDEFIRYSYKIDKHTEEILPILVDKHNHYIDALRYALEPIMRSKKVSQAPILGLY